ncbi:hypothetical protein G4B88_006778 [Cannabis sativa]|uniref:Uncharacterized protein n=1 Tax=Cannabis sativa TaxID=3483 RepID=A0A7J6GUA1_CANSA|nr:hypothetical protein G4B88_006778 [Cannabis sativa]
MIPFLTSGVPNLGLDDLIVDLNTASSELDTNGGLGFEAELVSGEARQQIRFSDAGVSYQNHLEKIVIVVVCSRKMENVCVPFEERKRELGIAHRKERQSGVLHHILRHLNR